jgi:hypothetical protein
MEVEDFAVNRFLLGRSLDVFGGRARVYCRQWIDLIQAISQARRARTKSVHFARAE